MGATVGAGRFGARPKRRGRTLSGMSELADVAALLADRTRARILEELLGGPALPAGALAVRVGVAPSTVSGHLAKLEAAGLIVIHARGRRREAQLARPEVAEALEALSRLASGDARPIGLRAVNGHAALREARSCYDHLAGRAGVRLADSLVARGALTIRDGTFARRRRRALRATRSGSTWTRCRGAAHAGPGVHGLDRTPPARGRGARRRAARRGAGARLGAAARRRARAEPHGRRARGAVRGLEEAASSGDPTPGTSGVYAIHKRPAAPVKRGL